MITGLCASESMSYFSFNKKREQTWFCLRPPGKALAARGEARRERTQSGETVRLLELPFPRHSASPPAASSRPPVARRLHPTAFLGAAAGWSVQPSLPQPDREPVTASSSSVPRRHLHNLPGGAATCRSSEALAGQRRGGRASPPTPSGRRPSAHVGFLPRVPGAAKPPRVGEPRSPRGPWSVSSFLPSGALVTTCSCPALQPPAWASGSWGVGS